MHLRHHSHWKARGWVGSGSIYGYGTGYGLCLVGSEFRNMHIKECDVFLKLRKYNLRFQRLRGWKNSACNNLNVVLTAIFFQCNDHKSRFFIFHQIFFFC